MHFNGRFIVNIADFAATQGADFKSLVMVSGHTKEELCEEDCRLGADIYDQVLLEALHQTRDDLFGLHVGQHLNLAAAGLIAQIAQTSDTVLEALQYCCEFSNLGCSALPMHLVEESFCFKVVLKPNAEWLSTSPASVFHTTLGHLVFTVREFQTLTHQKYDPQQINLIFAEPKKSYEIGSVFGCPVKYNQMEISIAFEKRHLVEKVVTRDYKLLQVLVHYAQQKIAAINAETGFYHRVKESVVHLIKPDFPTLQQIAEHLNLSVRTLQRRLKAEGRSYKELLDELRFDFAMKYISDPALSINEIAYLLSYSDASTFIRSFKRWTGKTPGEYRG